ncbi:DUF899 family protein [Arthrobacter globiformis]|uniref:DUF899 family protein n=1 Tax=Arthrobacter globiformis TaxID=1665 RepID=UPI0027869D95|nr:DUF899 family protein [Arthrobacter globiformis]MDQ0865276.1 putative dithiol-disulfide oxidoreductase (DUF899 family) [Arthrobacter globiformis]
MVGIAFPNETPDYRAARNSLLERELALRRQMEAVAAELRALPPGGQVREDYTFDRMGPDGVPETVKMSALFGVHDTLMLYHYMFPRHSTDDRPGPPFGVTADLPLRDGPCPSCTALIDTWEGTMPHFEGLGGNLMVVARAPIERVAAFARDKGWKHIKLLSAAHNDFRRHYGGDNPNGEPEPIMTVFKREPDGTIRLHWASELLFEPADSGQDPRHLGTVEPLWTLFDLTPAGRPAADEQIEYPCCP